MPLPYQNRMEAGRQLAQHVRALADRNPLVLALPRGGVPVGYEIAAALDAPLDLLLVRKLGVPGHEELACGAIATGGARVINQDVVRRLGITNEALETVSRRELAELKRRENVYRGDEPEPDVSGRHVIVVDDGLATGATMRAGVQALRQNAPAMIIVAVPVGPPEAVRELATEADQVVCAAAPDSFRAVGQCYVEFAEVSDAQVRDVLHRNWHPVAPPR